MLYKKTRLEDTFGVNMLAVADGRPETMGLKSIIEYFLDFQYDLTTRKYRTLLNKELEKKEIQEGLIKACNVIDLIIEILRGSQNIRQAKECLVNGITDGIRFKTKASQKAAARLLFTENQAAAILEMRLYKLIGLEIEALEKEYDQTVKNIASYEDILENHSSMSRVIKKELNQIKKAYARPRKTMIENAKEAVYEEKKIEEMPVVFLMDRFGYCKCIDPSTYERNREAADGENKYVISCLNTDKICIFTDSGRMHTIKVQDAPCGRFRDKGTPADNLCNYDSSTELMVYVDSLSAVTASRLLFTTSGGYLKQVAGLEFDVTKRSIAATKLMENDRLIHIAVSSADQQMILQTHHGYFIRFMTAEIPEKKKGAIGVRGIKLGSDDFIENAYVTNNTGSFAIHYKDQQIMATRIKLTARDTKGTKLRI